ncbi:MAG TPA: hypothetical protein VLK33_11600 [Terriglobales bacterium]|nr:hypothetical protein [Terriglobales bacterium]
MKNTLSSFARSKALILALGILFALPAIASAQGFKGKFTLAAETHWGTAVLTPGSYEFAVDSTSAPTKIMVRDEQNKMTAIVIPMWNSNMTREKTNKLQLTTVGNEIFISAVYLKDVDAELYFALPVAKEVSTASIAAKPAATLAASVQ